MRKQLFIAILLLISNQSSIYSQTGKYWGDWYSPYLLGEFKTNSDIQPYSKDLGPQTLYGKYTSFIQSSFNGDLMFLGGSLRIYDTNGIPLKNSDKLYIPQYSIGMQTGDNSWDALGAYYVDSANGYGPFYAKKYLLEYYCQTQNCFDSFKYYPYGFYKTEVKRDSNNIGYVSEKNQNKYFNLPIKRIQLFDVKRSFDYKYHLLGYRPGDPMKVKENRSVGLYHFSYQSNDLKILDSFIFNSFNYLPDSIIQRVPIYGLSFEMKYAHLSRNRDKIFVNLSLVLPSMLLGYSKEILFEINVDPISGKFLSIPKIIYENAFSNYKFFKLTLNINSYANEGVYPISDLFSPNDSILYLQRTERKITLGKTTELNQKVIAWRLREEIFSKC